MRAYSMDRRERVLRDSDAGMNAAAVAVKYHVSASWVRRRSNNRRRETGEVAPRQQRYGRHPGTARAPAAHARGAEYGFTRRHDCQSLRARAAAGRAGDVRAPDPSAGRRPGRLWPLVVIAGVEQKAHYLVAAQRRRVCRFPALRHVRQSGDDLADRETAGLHARSSCRSPGAPVGTR